MPSQKKLKTHQITLISAGVLTLLGFAIPVLQRVFLPLQYLNTHLHEFSHAITAQVTGAHVQQIIVRADGSGETPVAGGLVLLVASAGYVGASIFGAAMIYAARTERGARSMLWTLFVLMVISLVIWVRGDSIGVVSGIGWAIVLGICAVTLKGPWLQFVTQFLGLQQCLNAVHSVFTLLQISVATEVHSDATILAEVTGLPSYVWAFGWAGFSLLLVGFALRRSWAQTGPGG
jgi:hypothetical protein